MLEKNATDYHIAKIIESEDEHVKTFVAEADGRVVGFMSCHAQVNAKSLSEWYHLAPYDIGTTDTYF